MALTGAQLNCAPWGSAKKMTLTKDLMVVGTSLTVAQGLSTLSISER